MGLEREDRPSTPARVAAAAGEPRVFRRGLAGAVLQAVIASVIVGVAAAFIVPGVLPIYTSRTTRATLTLVAIAVALVVIWGTPLWLRNLTVVVTPERVTVRRPVGEVAAFARSETVFGSTVTQNRVNGMKSSVTRTLIAHGPQGESRVDLPGFSRSTFNALVELIAPLGESVAETEPRLPQATSFTLDTSVQRSRSRRFAWAALILGAVALGAAVAALNIDDDGMRVVGGTLALFALVAGIGLAIGAGQAAALARRHPSRLMISGAGIHIDGADYAYARLSRIWVTPTAYSRSSIQLIGHDGSRMTWPLAGPGVSMSPDYLVFVHSLRIATHHHPGLVALDLE